MYLGPVDAGNEALFALVGDDDSEGEEGHGALSSGPGLVLPGASSDVGVRGAGAVGGGSGAAALGAGGAGAPRRPLVQELDDD